MTGRRGVLGALVIAVCLCLVGVVSGGPANGLQGYQPYSIPSWLDVGSAGQSLVEDPVVWAQYGAPLLVDLGFVFAAATLLGGDSVSEQTKARYCLEAANNNAGWPRFRYFIQGAVGGQPEHPSASWSTSGSGDGSADCNSYWMERTYPAVAVKAAPWQRQMCNVVQLNHQGWAGYSSAETAWLGEACPVEWRPYFTGDGPAPTAAPPTTTAPSAGSCTVYDEGGNVWDTHENISSQGCTSDAASHDPGQCNQICSGAWEAPGGATGPTTTTAPPIIPPSTLGPPTTLSHSPQPTTATTSPQPTATLAPQPNPNMNQPPPEGGGGDGSVIDGLFHLGDRIVGAVWDLAGRITRPLVDALADGWDLLRWIGGLIGGMWSALAALLQWIGSLIDGMWRDLSGVLRWIGGLLQGGFDGVKGLLSGANATLSRIWYGVLDLPARIGDVLGRLFVPDQADVSDLQTKLQAKVATSAPVVIVGGVVGLGGSLGGSLTAALASGSGSCGPSIGWDASDSSGASPTGPAIPGFRVRLPAPAPCPGNGPNGSRTANDERAADLLGYRLIVRGMAMFAMLWTVAMSFASAAPWSHKADQIAPRGSGAFGDVHDLSIGASGRYRQQEFGR